MIHCVLRSQRFRFVPKAHTILFIGRASLRFFYTFATMPGTKRALNADPTSKGTMLAYFKSDAPEKEPVEKKKKAVAKEEEEVDASAVAVPAAGNGGSSSSGKYSDMLLSSLVEPGWKKALQAEFNKPYFKSLMSFLDAEHSRGAQIFPPHSEVFSALNLTPIDQVKVVILGQDPYHDVGQAHGLCFSVKKGVKAPPSLVNIYKELTTDIPGFKTPNHGFLEKWAKEGILLLNATLTVEAHKANSHAKSGWLEFTDEIIRVLNKQTKGVVFILWGGFAQKKGKIIDRKVHHVIEAAHPSPLSVTKFLGCKVFSKTNSLLQADGKQPVDWTLPQSI